jgi:two-component system, chemotaxis family, chemotaxis protein CheY
MSNAVFIVDDEEFIHQLYKDILEFNGYRVVGDAYDGSQAVDMYKVLAERPDVIIMDHRMPKKDGVETTLEIKQMDPNVRVIFASADSTIREKALSVGADSFLIKPFKIQELIAAIRSSII